MMTPRLTPPWVSLGCLGIIYAVVLRVRKPYGLVETTTETTWQLFKLRASTYLEDATSRFLQVVVSPYRDGNAENVCLVMTRSEIDETGPGTRPRGDVEGAVTAMIREMGLLVYVNLCLHGVFDSDLGMTDEQRFVKIIQGVLTHAPGPRRSLDSSRFVRFNPRSRAGVNTASAPVRAARSSTTIRT
jgi:hypothetical protein